MKYNLLILLSILLFPSFYPGKKWTPLLDKNLLQWDVYLSYPHKSTHIEGLAKNAEGEYIEPIGLNKDEKKVFSVIMENGKPVLRISGEIYGGISTKNEFGNYHLKLQIKWGEKKHEPRLSEPMNSGLLYHSVEPHGADYWKTWMRSQECQIMQGRFGDYWSLDGAKIDIYAVKREADGNYIFQKNAPPVSYGAGEEGRNHCEHAADFEKPKGEWNTVELICFEGKSLHIINGNVAMALANSRQMVDEKEIPMRKGKIQLQCEEAELFYKNIEIKNIKKMPKKYRGYFLEK